MQLVAGLGGGLDRKIPAFYSSDWTVLTRDNEIQTRLDVETSCKSVDCKGSRDAGCPARMARVFCGDSCNSTCMVAFQKEVRLMLLTLTLERDFHSSCGAAEKTGHSKDPC